MNNQILNIASCNIMFAISEYIAIAIMDCSTGCMVPDRIVGLLKFILGLRILYNTTLIIFNSNEKERRK